MDNNIILFFLFVLLAILIYSNNKEKYNNLCQNCDDMSLEDCAKCSDCGVCYKNGVGKCVRGTEYSPLFHDMCEKWEYLGKEPTNECYLYNDEFSQYNCGGYISYPTRNQMHRKYAKTYGTANYNMKYDDILKKIKL